MTDDAFIASEAEEFRLLVDAVEDYAIFFLSAEGEIRSWNPGAERIFGYPASEVVGRTFSMFYPPDAIAERKPQRELETALAEGRVEDEGWRLRRDGTLFWADTIITRLVDEGGSLRGFAKITRDLTARRSGEAQLRRSEEMFRVLIEAVEDYAIFMIDPKGLVMTWNRGAQRIKGYQASEILGRPISVFYSAADQQRAADNLARAEREGKVEDEGWRVRKDGTRFWANVVITAIRDDQGRLRGFAKVTRDISDRRRAEETERALLRQREATLRAEEQKRRAERRSLEAQLASRAKDDFLMTLSHELRTPMTSILGWARLLPTIPPSDPGFWEAVAAIAESATLQSRLIDDVLDASQVASGSMSLALREIDVAAALAKAVEAVRPAATAKHVELSVLLAADLGSAVLDPVRLQQVAWNLLSNSVRFTPAGGSVELTALRQGEELHLRVRDSGEGIDPSFLPHIFEPFRQAENPMTRVHGGLGLGLSIVRYIVEAHGGTIRASSSGLGKGAEFDVVLPLRRRGEQLGEQTLTRRRTAPPEILGGVDVVLVEGDATGRDELTDVLVDAGAIVRSFDSVPTAIGAIATRRPDLLVSALTPPGEDRYELVRRVLRQPGSDEIRIAMLSSFPEAVSGDLPRIDVYIQKPVDPRELVERLAAIVRRK